MAQYILKDAVVEVSYDFDNKQLVLVFETTNRTEIVNVAIDDFVDTYTVAGNGLKLGKRLILC